MILIQRIRKIKGQKWFREIIWDSIFYLLFFVIGVTLVFSRLEKGRETPLILEKTGSVMANSSSNLDIIENDTKYVASSRGKYFYEIGSNRANSLSEKNKIYFSSPEEAKKLGFKPYFDI